MSCNKSIIYKLFRLLTFCLFQETCLYGTQVQMFPHTKVGDFPSLKVILYSSHQFLPHLDPSKGGILRHMNPTNR